jgi:hypothetical protein
MQITNIITTGLNSSSSKYSRKDLRMLNRKEKNCINTNFSNVSLFKLSSNKNILVLMSSRHKMLIMGAKFRLSQEQWHDIYISTKNITFLVLVTRGLWLMMVCKDNVQTNIDYIYGYFSLWYVTVNCLWLHINITSCFKHSRVLINYSFTGH